jgi:MFS family permease
VPAQLLPLAVLAAITSPTALAAVLVILNRPQPIRLLTGYVIGSFAMSMLIGLAIVGGLAASSLFAPHQRSSLPVLDIVLGVLILVSAVWLRSPRSAAVRRRTSLRHAQRQAERERRRAGRPSRASQVLTSGSLGLVTALGAAMHLPGLLYLAALANIAHAGLGTGRTVILLLLFNLVMLTPIELPLAGCLVAPARTRDTIQRFDAYIRAHRTEGLLAGSLVAAGYLIVSGIVGLAS